MPLDTRPPAPLPADGGALPTEEAIQPSLDSTAGLSAADLSARPDPAGGYAPDQAGLGQTPTDPNMAAAAGSPEGQAQSIRDAAKFYGLDLSQYDDDAQAFAYLAQQALAAKQRNYYTELGQQIAPHAGQVQQYLRDYQQRQQGQAPAQRPPHEAPAFDERWMTLVDRDQASGRFVPKAGVNPQYADAVNEYADHVEQWTTSLARNPREALAPLIQEVARELLETRFGAHAAQAQAQSIISSNEGWLYQVDANGRRVVDRQGLYQPTPLGARYYTHLQTLQRSGVRDAATLDTLAKHLLQADLAAGAAQGTQQATQAAGPQARQAMGNPNVNPGQAVNPARRHLVPGATDPDEAGLSLSEQMRRAMHAEGVTDSDFQRMFS